MDDCCSYPPPTFGKEIVRGAGGLGFIILFSMPEGLEMMTK
jgi:hypothetical protein